MRATLQCKPDSSEYPVTLQDSVKFLDFGTSGNTDTLRPESFLLCKYCTEWKHNRYGYSLIHMHRHKTDWHDYTSPTGPTISGTAIFFKLVAYLRYIFTNADVSTTNFLVMLIMQWTQITHATTIWTHYSTIRLNKL